MTIKESDNLRKRAEAKLGFESVNLSKMSEEDICIAFQELHTHQIELEIQNEELRLAQEQLEVSRTNFSNLYDFAPIGYLTVNDKGLIRKANLTVSIMLGVERSFLLKQPLSSFIFSEDQDHYYQFRKILFETKKKQTCELQMIKKDGNLFHARMESVVIPHLDGESGQFRTVITDVSERKQVEVEIKKHRDQLEELVAERTDHLRIINEELQKEIADRIQVEERLKINEKILNKAQGIAHIGSWHLDIQKNIFFWSDEIYRIFGLTPQEFGATYEAFLKMIHPDDREMVNRTYTDAINNNIPYECVHRVVRPDGTVRIVQEKSENIVNESGQTIHSFGMTHDITEQKQAEEDRQKLHQKLLYAKKMESLGLMAGGIAHDLNNILSGIVSYPELLLMQLPDNSPLREYVVEIKNSGELAADVVSDLLTIAKGVATNKKAQNLNTIVDEYLGSAEHKCLDLNQPGVVFEKELDAELLNIRCSSQHMKKIIMNLVLNAFEAFEHQGKVTIKTANRYLDEPLRGYEDVQIGEYVLLTISDTGRGISQDDIAMVFEPFFTKKVMGRSGTGLGLAVVWNAVNEHNGYINVISNEKGTKFELYFPVTRDEVTAEEKHISFEDYLGSGEKILVVDDQQNQREIACKLLIQMGYVAEAVSSGEEAIQYLEKKVTDLLVLDMIMPDMNGRETYEKVIKIHPNQKVIIASGFAESEDVEAVQKLGAGKYVKKPYTIENIGIAVRDELKK